MLTPAQLLLIERLIAAFLIVLGAIDAAPAPSPGRAVTRFLVARLVTRLEHLRAANQLLSAATDPATAPTRPPRTRRRRERLSRSDRRRRERGAHAAGWRPAALPGLTTRDAPRFPRKPHPASAPSHV